MFSVSDTGSGMSKDIIDKIFDPYFTTKKIGEGTGLGLSVVHGIVKNCNGEIRVYSEPGKGSNFEIYFPRIDVCKQEDNYIMEFIPSGHTGKILIVDDENDLLEVAVPMLEHMGYNVYAATDTRDAIEIFKKEFRSFDLVITDQTMPGMTGLNWLEIYVK